MTYVCVLVAEPVVCVEPPVVIHAQRSTPPLNEGFFVTYWCDPGTGVIQVLERSRYWCNPGTDVIQVLVLSRYWCGPDTAAIKVFV